MKQRFPRWNLTKEEKLVWALLRFSYNKMAKSRNEKKRLYNYDVYKTKVGLRAMYSFLMVTPKLIELGINPDTFVKVLCQYGKWGRNRAMPHPAFFMNPKALQIFSWLVKKNRDKFGLDKEWKQSLEGPLTPQEVYNSVRSAARIFKAARKQLGVNSSQTFLAVFKDLSPAFTAMYILKSKQWKSLLQFIRIYRDHKDLNKAARSAFAAEFYD